MVDVECKRSGNVLEIEFIDNGSKVIVNSQAPALPIDGLKSVVFEGPSPTWCVASGNVWFDYPDHQKTGCVDQRVLKLLQDRDNKDKPYFDWKYSYSRHKVCLRLSEH
eukprot:gene23569-26677_t